MFFPLTGHKGLLFQLPVRKIEVPQREISLAAAVIDTVPRVRQKVPVLAVAVKIVVLQHKGNKGVLGYADLFAAVTEADAIMGMNKGIKVIRFRLRRLQSFIQLFTLCPFVHKRLRHGQNDFRVFHHLIQKGIGHIHAMFADRWNHLMGDPTLKILCLWLFATKHECIKPRLADNRYILVPARGVR